MDRLWAWDMWVRLAEKVVLVWGQKRHSSGMNSMSISFSESESDCESEMSSSEEGDFDLGFGFDDGLAGGVIVVPGWATLQRSL